jgi:hypothetical protein
MILRAALLLTPPAEHFTAHALALAKGGRIGAFERLQADLDPGSCAAATAARTAAADGDDEACGRCGPVGGGLRTWARGRLPGVRRGLPASPRRDAGIVSSPSGANCSTVWADEWTVASLLCHLTGEDFRQSLQPALIRHLAAHLDQGLAAWKKPGAVAGFLRGLASVCR